MEAFKDKTVLLPFKSMKLKIPLEVSRHANETILLQSHKIRIIFLFKKA
jgi:hypothetical protein